MTSKTFTLNEMTLGLILDTISHSEIDGSIQVTIHPAREKRRVAQNSLYWKWLDELSSQTGYNKDELHHRFKTSYMIPIYMHHSENTLQHDWTCLFDIITQDGTALMVRKAQATVSSSWATVSQFTEYLNEIEKFCQSKGLELPADPNYAQAMGLWYNCGYSKALTSPAPLII